MARARTRPSARLGLLLAALLVAVLGAGGPPPRLAAADDPDDAAARAKRIEEARRARAEADRALALRVDAAVAKGASWLRALQRPDGSFASPGADPETLDVQDLGRGALCVWALVQASGAGEPPAVTRGLERLRDVYDGPPSRGPSLKHSMGLRTYSVATYLLALDAVGRARAAAAPVPPEPTGKGKRPTKPAPRPDELPLMRELATWLVENRTERAWRYPGGVLGSPVAEDLSNTQLALLALDAAARRGVAVPDRVWTSTAEWCLATQQPTGPEVVRRIHNEAFVPGTSADPDAAAYGEFMAGPTDRARGWAYTAGSPVVTGSMTSAGIASLAIAKERLDASKRLDPALEKRLDRGMLDGIAWLASRFTARTNPGQGDGGWHLYYLYGLERAGAMTGLSHFGTHDWYREGAEVLLDAQASDGSWGAAPATDANARLQPPLVQTSLALLFLRRGTPPPAKRIGPVLTKD